MKGPRGSARHAALAALSCAALALTGCMSATALDLRLTRFGRTALPGEGQPPAQQVADAAACREAILDGLFHAGAYVLYNPLRFSDGEAAARGLEGELARCLRRRGYAIER